MKRLALSLDILVSSLLAATLLSVSLSCSLNKNHRGQARTGSDNSLISKITTTLNSETTRLVNAVDGHLYEVGVIGNTMGEFDRDRGHNIHLMGMTEPKDSVSIKLNGTKYAAASNGQWNDSRDSLKNYFNADVTIEVLKGIHSVSKNTVHVPLPRFCTISSATITTINRFGNTLTWTPDSNNVLEKIFLRYSTGDIIDHPITDGFLVLDDNGSYDIDYLIADPTIKTIRLYLVSGNGVATTINSRKILVCILHSDNHEYNIN